MKTAILQNTIYTYTKAVAITCISILFIIILASNQLHSQSVKDMGINIRAKLDTINRRVTFNWDSDSNTYNYYIYKKKTSDSLFGNYVEILTNDITQWSDTLLDNQEIEYKIEKDAGIYYAYGYIIAGLNIKEKDYYGTVLILVDSTIYSSIGAELSIFVNDIIGDGWRVIVKQAPRAETFDSAKVQITKGIIMDTYKESKDLTSLILLGRIAVPYSGNFAVDGHDDHFGAWPTDLYYAELNGIWTDTLKSRFDVIPRTMNLPNDGKFDQTYITSDVELQIGRIDLYNLPFFEESEIELIKRYLLKVSLFKNGKVSISKRAGIIDNFGPSYKEGFATSGWTNFYSLLGGDSVYYLKDRFELQKKDYIWYYGCGPGAYVASHEAMYAEELAKSPFYVAFNMVFGSYNGDWDSQNNVLRSILGSQPYGYSAVWAGRPHWFFHHLAYGYNLGYCTKLTQNVYPNNYANVSPFARRMNHIALMGDPTLRMSYFETPDSVLATNKGSAIELTWNYLANNNISFNIYRANNINGKFEKINTNEISEHKFVDKMPLIGNNIYMVRAKRKETEQAGTYYNLSIGKFSNQINFPDNLGTDIIIAPNPFVDNITIMPKSTENISKIQFYDNNGKLIGNKMIANENNSLIKIKVSEICNYSLGNGVYFIRIYNGDMYKDYKLIKK